MMGEKKIITISNSLPLHVVYIYEIKTYLFVFYSISIGATLDQTQFNMMLQSIPDIFNVGYTDFFVPYCSIFSSFKLKECMDLFST